MYSRFLLLLSVAVLLLLPGCGKESKYEEMGEFAPADAYENGSEHPFYGSENEWDQRFF